MLISKAYTLIEMLLVLTLISVLLMIQFKIIPISKLNMESTENQIKDLILHLNYIKSQAIKDNQPITIVISPKSEEILIVEQNHEFRRLKLPADGKIHYRTNVRRITFERDGSTSKFGSLFINIKDELYRIICHIDKGRIRYEKA
ncbi:competence type IV pilus minor pilin ComGD [Staphylococcus sp. ACRSN]|uniref:competence type IV pilus minor pilin ComGD n=1 Tax=Staphylococcus sp. ACRSN TaxID=2918214 RepID=UPI001EF38088|nr:competence type IV pilus minor pilin ComGD [Staphylococcus sp. ACRSN]